MAFSLCSATATIVMDMCVYILERIIEMLDGVWVHFRISGAF